MSIIPTEAAGSGTMVILHTNTTARSTTVATSYSMIHYRPPPAIQQTNPAPY